MTSQSLVRFCIAEYCAGPFYMGWWLYERDTNDGRVNHGPWSDGWGWMRSADSWSDQQKLNDLCCGMGCEPPPVKRYSQKFAEWFAKTFPNGLRVRVLGRDEGYELVEVVKKRPRQQRGVIRTVRGAAMATKRRRKNRRKRISK